MIGRLRGGFTLIEVLIVVAILGIVASVAYPIYTKHVITARRGAAHTALLDVLRRQQRHHVERRTYVSLSALGYPADTIGIGSGGLVVDAGSGLYDLSIVTEPGPGNFEAQAVATGAQRTDDACPVISIDADATRGPTFACW